MIIQGDCLEKLKESESNSVDACVTDPPYELGFMGKSWDNTGIAYRVELWQEVLRVLKPGGHLLSFGGSRTYHRMACAIEDAGFEIRDQIMWVYGSGFPKSLNIGKAFDKIAGEERPRVTVADGHSSDSISNTGFGKEGWAKQNDIPISDSAKKWNGYGTALKPAHEPIVLARKPLSEKTVAENVLKWGVGGLAIDNCRVGTETIKSLGGRKSNMAGDNRDEKGAGMFAAGKPNLNTEHQGRFPANLIHDGSDEVVDLFPNSKATKPHGGDGKPLDTREQGWGFKRTPCELSDNGGSAARFFYCAKASKSERDRGCEDMPITRPDTRTPTGMGSFEQKGVLPGHNNHPTVKPLALMKYLVTLISREGQTVLDPFMGSGTTGMACKELNREFIGIEKEEQYFEIAKKRIGVEDEEEVIFI